MGWIIAGSFSALECYDCKTAGQEIHQDQAQAAEVVGRGRGGGEEDGPKSVPLGQPSQNLCTFLLLFSSLDCLYTNTAHLEVNFRVDVIKPGKSMEVPIIFYPRESISYRELIPFEINGLSQQVVEIKGKGTEMKVRGDPQTGSFPALPRPHGPPSPPPSPPSPSPAPELLYHRSAVPLRGELANQWIMDLTQFQTALYSKDRHWKNSLFLGEV